jgi:transposase InsO family protein
MENDRRSAPSSRYCRRSRFVFSFEPRCQGGRTPGSESFNSRARDELFAREIFHSILEARVLYDDWRHTYNTYRPHSALNWLPPAQYASQWSGATIQ